MTETLASIADWANATFGPVRADLRVAARANQELAEMLRAVTAGVPAARIVEEGAGVLIVLARLAPRLGVAPEIREIAVDLPDITILSVTILAMSDMRRLVEALANEDRRKAGVILNSLWNCVCLAIGLAGSTAAQAINARMAVNREGLRIANLQRRWNGPAKAAAIACGKSWPRWGGPDAA